MFSHLLCEGGTLLQYSSSVGAAQDSGCVHYVAGRAGQGRGGGRGEGVVLQTGAVGDSSAAGGVEHTSTPPRHHHNLGQDTDPGSFHLTVATQCNVTSTALLTRQVTPHLLTDGAAVGRLGGWAAAGPGLGGPVPAAQAAELAEVLQQTAVAGPAVQVVTLLTAGLRTTNCSSLLLAEAASHHAVRTQHNVKTGNPVLCLPSHPGFVWQLPQY